LHGGRDKPTFNIMRLILRATMYAVGFLGVTASAAGAQRRPSLGPVDGRDLPPLDTGRVTAGTMAPDFTLESKDGGTVTLSQFRGKKDVVLVFYRGHW
jgi:cytochrome oxidase Cu insertion factor (SCO1/SenC/PrrC family)